MEPFTTSILDGIDMRETIHKWYEGRIYVRQYQKIQGEVGSIVVIFDEDRDNRYPYTTTWLGENQNESDMAFYSTFPFDNLVGPGIGRAEYGGFLMSLPPRRMYDVWQDADYEFAESKSERLLLAALDYSDPSLRGLRGRQAAAVHLQDHRLPRGPHGHLYSHRTALSGIAQKDPRGARFGRLRQTRHRQRLPLVVAACRRCRYRIRRRPTGPGPTVLAAARCRAGLSCRPSGEPGCGFWPKGWCV